MRGFNIFCKIDGQNIPLVLTGTSPFIGAGQFRSKGYVWRERFLNNVDAMIEILEASYHAGAKGSQIIPIGKIIEAAYMMKGKYDDYVVTASTYPAMDSGIERLMELDPKLIFVHGMISDRKDKKLNSLLEDISSRGVIPGVATHEPINTINYVIRNNLNVRVFLIPFNALGMFMDDKNTLEKIVDNNNQYFFIGMKTLAAGKLNPKEAFDYISKHNIKAVSIGMVTSEEAKESTNAALRILFKN